jgi:hypothetical protein
MARRFLSLEAGQYEGQRDASELLWITTGLGAFKGLCLHAVCFNVQNLLTQTVFAGQTVVPAEGSNRKDFRRKVDRRDRRDSIHVEVLAISALFANLLISLRNTSSTMQEHKEREA